jgi:hypothetical protein
VPQGAAHLEGGAGAPGLLEPVQRRAQVGPFGRQATHPTTVTGSSRVARRRLGQRQIVRGVSLARCRLFTARLQPLERELAHRLEHQKACLVARRLLDL